MVIYVKLSDSELTKLLIAGDKDAFAEIYDRYWSIMYTHAYKIFKSKADTHDILQDLFTNLWVKCKDINADTKIAGYLYLSLRHKCLDYIQKQKTATNYLASLGQFAGTYSNRIIENISEKEIYKILDQEIENLPAKMKLIFELRLKHHKSYSEIAQILNISDKTVKKQVSNAIKTLKPKVKGYYMLGILLMFVKYF